jgi:G protein-coupled receptor GPR1
LLIITIHSTLYIFNPPASISEGGLYLYRYIAYILWITLPLIIASLAFTNPNGAYQAGGTSYHLPVRPFWYQLALGWILRYIIFLIILGSDVSIYFYIRYKFGNFSQSNNTSAVPSRKWETGKRRQRQNWTGKNNGRYSLPQTSQAVNAINASAMETATASTSVVFEGPNLNHNLDQISLMQTRSKIKQQLRFLFIYPLAYMALWALPFVFHSLEYNDYYVVNPPFLLAAIDIVITVSQPAVDCWIFNIKERPWRQLVKNTGSVVKGLAYLKDLRSGWRGSSPLWGGGGKSKSTMKGEARIAY